MANVRRLMPGLHLLPDQQRGSRWRAHEQVNPLDAPFILKLAHRRIHSHSQGPEVCRMLDAVLAQFGADQEGGQGEATIWRIEDTQPVMVATVDMVSVVM